MTITVRKTPIIPRAARAGASSYARTPRNVQLLGGRDRGIIIQEFASCSCAVCCERDSVIDVEDPGNAAGGPDGSSSLNLAVLSVDLAVNQLWAGDGALGTFLRAW